MAKYVLRICERFEAAHHLRAYRGAPEPVHGHSWRVELVLESEQLGKEGMAFDFVEAKSALGGLAAKFHHRDINSVPPFDQLSPTTEHLARWFHQQLAAGLPAANVAEVTVWEGPDCSATYRP
nr:6-carboxy-5,6,7,8-tetrahydropterin synthase-like [Nerophis lumbriciformis]